MSPTPPREPPPPRRLAICPILATGAVLALCALARPAVADEPPPATPPTTPAPEPPGAPPSPPAAPQDPGTAPDPLPPPALPASGELLPWAGTWFSWGHAVSASILSIPSAENDASGFNGQVSPANRYAQAFSLSGGYFILRRPPHQLRISTTVAVDAELTNPGTTIQKREPDLRDIPLRLVYTPTLWSKGDGGPIRGDAALFDPTLLGRGDHRTWGLVAGSLRFPVSRVSRGAGLLLGTSLSAGLRQQVALLGSGAPGLTHLVVTVSETWSHLFYKATTPVSSDLAIPRVDASGTAFASDQLRGTPNVENQLTTAVSLTLPLYERLQLDTTFRFHHDFRYSVSGGSGCTVLATGCVDLSPGTTGSVVASTTFGIGLSYLILPELSVDLGYWNTASQIGSNGTYRNPFVSPDALLYADLTLSFDRLYQRFADPGGLRATLGEPPDPPPVP